MLYYHIIFVLFRSMHLWWSPGGRNRVTILENLVCELCKLFLWIAQAFVWTTQTQRHMWISSYLGLCDRYRSLGLLFHFAITSLCWSLHVDYHIFRSIRCTFFLLKSKGKYLCVLWSEWWSLELNCPGAKRGSCFLFYKEKRGCWKDPAQQLSLIHIWRCRRE